jgi:hypothetical protein
MTAQPVYPPFALPPAACTTYWAMQGDMPSLLHVAGAAKTDGAGLARRNMTATNRRADEPCETLVPTAATNHAGYACAVVARIGAIAAAGPLPDVARHVHDPEWAGPRAVVAHRAGSLLAALAIPAHLKTWGAAPPRGLAAVRAARSALPLLLGRQAVTSPVAVGGCLLPVDAVHWTVTTC